MAEGILGLGQGQAASLNSDMLEKLKAVDRKATVEPIEKKLEKFESEKKVISDVTTKVNELFGYGAGYGILPYFEGGVGVSCYPKIFEKIGFNFRQTGNGKMYDSFEVTKSV